jgi:hypothetical protein
MAPGVVLIEKNYGTLTDFGGSGTVFIFRLFTSREKGKKSPDEGQDDNPGSGENRATT